MHYVHAHECTDHSLQKPLPKLPVPALHDTLAKYLRTIRPVVSEATYQRTEALVTQFRRPGGQGEELQKRLEAFAENTECWVIINTQY